MTTSDPRETEHIECDCVPDIGPSHCHLCSERAGHPVPWSEAHPDGAPGDHDELLARAERVAGALEEYEFEGIATDAPATMNELIAALRTEQSARQAAEAQVVAIREWNTLTNGRPRYRELDRLVNPEAWIDPDAAPTESKESEPKLDILPMLMDGYRHAYDRDCEKGVPCIFMPDPKFSQNPADYGIEAPDRAWECRDCGNKWRTSRTPKSETCPECHSIMIAGGVVEHDEDRDVPHE